MIEAINKRHPNGGITKVKYSVKSNYKDMIVTFVVEEYSNNTRGKERALTNISFVRYKILMSYCQLDPTGEKMTNYIKQNLNDSLSVIDKIRKYSMMSNTIEISLPTSGFACPRGMTTACSMFKNTSLPLIVTIDGRDVSRMFKDFNVFEDKAVKMAYDALIDDNYLESGCDLDNFSKVTMLHKQIIKDDNMIESIKL